MGRLTALALALLLSLVQVQAASAAASPFAGWAAIVVAGDWHAHDGGPSEAFDNARRDVGEALLAAGFQPQNLREFSVRPDRYQPRPARTDVEGIYDALTQLAAHAPDGCLIYFTSHGAPSGVVVDDRLLAPGVLTGMLDETCGTRPKGWSAQSFQNIRGPARRLRTHPDGSATPSEQKKVKISPVREKQASKLTAGFCSNRTNGPALNKSGRVN